MWPQRSSPTGDITTASRSSLVRPSATLARPPGVNWTRSAMRSSPRAGMAPMPLNVMSRNGAPAQTTSTLMRTVPPAPGARPGSRPGSARPPRPRAPADAAPVHRKRLAARAAKRGVDRGPLGGAHLLDQALGLHRHVADRDRDDAARADQARHLDHRLGIQERHAGAVGRVQDHHPRPCVDHGIDDLQGDAAVATGLAGCAHLRHLDAPRRPGLGHVGRLAGRRSRPASAPARRRCLRRRCSAGRAAREARRLPACIDASASRSK